MKGKLTLVSLGARVCVVLTGCAERLVLELLFPPAEVLVGVAIHDHCREALAQVENISRLLRAGRIGVAVIGEEAGGSRRVRHLAVDGHVLQCTMYRATCNMQHATCNMQQATVTSCSRRTNHT